MHIVSATAGTVIGMRGNFQGTCAYFNNSCAFGNYVFVHNDDGTYLEYLHMQFGSVLVTPGQHVVPGQAIGQIGATGYTGGFAHLHISWLSRASGTGDSPSVADSIPGAFTGIGNPTTAQNLVSNNPGTTTPLHTAAALIPNDGASGYVLDGYGNLHPFGNAPAVNSPATWPGWDIARGLAVTGPGKGYVLDGYGGVHPFGGAPALYDPTYWSGWDIARGLALCPGGAGGYVLDGYGAVHPIGNAKPLSGGPYWPGWDIARGIVVNSACTGGYVLDGYGGVHPYGSAPGVNATAYWGGWDIARSITLVTDSSGYVLDGYGGIHPFAANGTPMPPALTGSTYQGGLDVYRSFVIDPVGGTGAQVSGYELQAGGSVTAGQVNVVLEPLIHTAAALIPRDGASGYVLDGYGNLHAFGNAPAVSSPSTWPGWDIARAIAVTAPGKGYILDGYGGLDPFGGAPALYDPTYWGWDIARGIALCPGSAGGYVLDGWGGIHPIGNAKPLSGGPYWSGWDIARGIVVNSACTGGYVLDGYGGVHPFGNAPGVSVSAYWGGWDIARSITLVTDSSGYVLDGYGGIHPFATNGAPMPPGLSNHLYDSAQTDPFDAFVYSPSLRRGIAVTRSNSNGLFWTDEAN
ncbi:MAG TPA: M23 family metallopeptidase [Solirubrobacteraceae bacterium]|nr:M23 family metallopeptidase [Solirubrobacteraceae bacterium]